MVTQEQLNHYWDKGWVVIEGVFDPREAERIAEVANAVIEEELKYPEHRKSTTEQLDDGKIIPRKILNAFFKHSAFQEFVLNDRFNKVIEVFLGDIPLLLAELDVLPTAMIDISDGLSSEIIHICKNSGVGCNLFEDKIPLDPQVISTCEEFNLDSTTIALSGGEDYELLFTIKTEDFPKIKANPHLTVIGHMTNAKEGMHLITRANTKIPLIARGWNSLTEK